MNKRLLVLIILLVFGFRVATFIVALGADIVLPYAPSFPYVEEVLRPTGLPKWVYSFANFDGVHYLTIARLGYEEVKNIQAFFPIFPAVILHSMYSLSGSVGVVLVGGLIFNGLMMILGLYVWYVLMEKTFSRRIARVALGVVLLWPTSLFLGAIYTESLFFFLVGACFPAAREKRWFWAIVFAGFASATRVTGVFLVPALWFEVWRQYGDKIKERQRLLLGVVFGATGLLIYCGYLWWRFGDPLLFAHVQADFGAGRSSNLISYPQVVWRYIKILVTARPFDLKYLIYLEEFIFGTLGLGVMIGGIKKVPFSWSIFSLLSFLLPTLTGSFLSMGRFSLSMVSLLALVSLIVARYKRVGYLWWMISAGLLALQTVMFLQGYWVA